MLAAPSHARCCIRLRASTRKRLPHELYLPYIISLYPRLAWEPLRPGHQTLFSRGSVADFQPLCALRRAEMYHPVKSECGAIEGYLLNPACRDCPHPARNVAD